MTMDTLHNLRMSVRDKTAFTFDECSSLLIDWIQTFDRSAHGDEIKLFNQMHIAGMALCVVYHTSTKSHNSKYNLAEALCQFANRILLTSVEIQDMTWQQTIDVISTIQIEFNTLFEPREGGGFTCCVKMQRMIIELMARLGFFLTHSWRCTQKEENEANLDLIQGVTNIDADGWHSVRPDSIIQALDALHAIATASWLILSAQSIPASDEPLLPIHSYHREASLDDFYTMSQIADCPMGAVTQYKHQFRHLFHSTSQVVFYHYPDYSRKKQLPMASLIKEDAEAIAVLPLIQQIAPTIPVIFEHTGAGLKTLHEKNAWQWVVLGGVVLLVDSNMRVYHGDPRRLLEFSQNSSSDESDDDFS